ncbi:MAG: FtsX-like permease family protein, partial [Pseudomonadota bacterium]
LMIGAVGDINIYSRADRNIENYEELIKKIKKEEVIDAIPVIEKQALLATNSSNIGVQVRGISPSDIEKKSLIFNKIIHGNINNFKDNGILIGLSLANQMGVHIGDKIRIMSPQTNSTVIGNIPRIKTCNIVGIFDSGTQEIDSLVVFMPLSLAQVYFKIPKGVNLIEVTLDKNANLDYYTEKLSKDLEYEYRIVNWKQRNESLMNALQIEKMAMFMILTLIMVVAAFNIISGLIMLVKDKTSNIAILRTMGITRASIVRIFLICGSSIGISGTILGLILGISFAENIETIRQFLQNITGTTIFDPLIYFLSFLPSKLYINDIMVITSMSTGLSVVATIYPAYRAAKLNPARILK